MCVRILFYDDEQREWVVQDGIITEGEFRTTHLGSSVADFRVFDLAFPRERRICCFAKGQQRGIDEPSLERQFLEARACGQRTAELRSRRNDGVAITTKPRPHATAVRHTFRSTIEHGPRAAGAHA